jgi:hypothetical protein
MVELGGHDTIEHGSTRYGRWLRERRLKISVSIAVAEGLLVVVGVINKWPAIVLAVLLISLYWVIGRKSRHDTFHEATWIAAASQAMMVFIPIFVAVFATVAIILLAIVAVVALFILFTDRN